MYTWNLFFLPILFSLFYLLFQITSASHSTGIFTTRLETLYWSPKYETIDFISLVVSQEIIHTKGLSGRKREIMVCACVTKMHNSCCPVFAHLNIRRMGIFYQVKLYKVVVMCAIIAIYLIWDAKIARVYLGTSILLQNILRLWRNSNSNVIIFIQRKQSIFFWTLFICKIHMPLYKVIQNVE